MSKNRGGGGRKGRAKKNVFESSGLKPNATGGKVRQINKKKQNTADVVNEAIRRGGSKDMAGAKESLESLGHSSPSKELIDRYASQKLLLSNIEKISGANATGQMGKWNFSSAQSILNDFDKYLSRRVSAQRSRWRR